MSYLADLYEPIYYSIRKMLQQFNLQISALQTSFLKVQQLEFVNSTLEDLNTIAMNNLYVHTESYKAQNADYHHQMSTHVEMYKRFVADYDKLDKQHSKGKADNTAQMQAIRKTMEEDIQRFIRLEKNVEKHCQKIYEIFNSGILTTQVEYHKNSQKTGKLEPKVYPQFMTSAQLQETKTYTYTANQAGEYPTEDYQGYDQQGYDYSNYQQSYPESTPKSDDYYNW